MRSLCRLPQGVRSCWSLQPGGCWQAAGRLLTGLWRHAERQCFVCCAAAMPPRRAAPCSVRLCREGTGGSGLTAWIQVSSLWVTSVKGGSSIMDKKI